MKPYYYIYRTDESRGPKIKHATLAEAQTEAERLANQHPGSTFEILQCVAITRCAQASTFWLDGHNPLEPRYRMLQNGEAIQSSDQFTPDDGYTWKFAEDAGSNYRDPTYKHSGRYPHLPHRRELCTAAPADIKRYRMLEKGERYLEGDEWQGDDGKWNKPANYGVVNGKFLARRPL